MQARAETLVGIFVLGALLVFFYMGFKIGAFRFDRMRYNEYTMYFNDVSGLSRKAEVKIAGVKVGWVESITLISDHDVQAEAKVYISKDYNIYRDAYAVVRQEGLLGPKYLEIIPGDPLLARLASGSTLGKPSVAPVSIDQLLQDIKKIVSHVEEITESFQGAIGGIEGRQQLRSIFDNLDVTTQRVASFTTILDRSISNNEDNLDRIFEIGNHVARISERLESQVLPSLQDGIDRIVHAFDRDFNRVATQIESSASAFEEASIQARDGFKSINAVAEKIDEGKGLIGKLINDEDTYRDLKVAVQGIKNYFASADTLQIVFDSHMEAMQRPAEIYKFEDSKGYFDMRIYPTEDKFYLIQLAVSERGYIDRFEVSKAYKDLKGNLVDTRKLLLTDAQRLEDVFTTERSVILRNSYKFGLQFGKIFGDIALRFGIFEGFAGLGVDFEIPLHSNRFRWITTFELFDLRGWNRRGVEATDDRRPHAKWINRMFILDNIYFTFGADDFASKRNANTFVGAGVRFCDDDVKFLLSGMYSLIPSLAANPDLNLTVNAGN